MVASEFRKHLNTIPETRAVFRREIERQVMRYYIHQVPDYQPPSSLSSPPTIITKKKD